jgi:hypothetical protein
VPALSNAILVRQVTARQLQRSVQEGLASASGDADSFESVQRRLLEAVQEASALEGKGSPGAAVQEALRKLFPNSYMCGKCGFGPVDHMACTDLRSQYASVAHIIECTDTCVWQHACVCTHMQKDACAHPCIHYEHARMRKCACTPPPHKHTSVRTHILQMSAPSELNVIHF